MQKAGFFAESKMIAAGGRRKFSVFSAQNVKILLKNCKIYAKFYNFCGVVRGPACGVRRGVGGWGGRGNVRFCLSLAQN